MRPLSRLAIRCCALLFPLAGMAAPAGYALDPVHTRLLVAVSHAGFSDALGTISGSRGQLWFDPDDWRSAKLAVAVPVARLDLGDAAWNRAALRPGLLDAGDHPLATFVSDRVEPGDPTHARVCGTLTLRGVARPLCMDVTFRQVRRHPLPPFRRTAGFSATATLRRSDFGITAWPTVIGDEVALRIEAEATADDRVRPDAIAAPAADAFAAPAAQDGP